MPVRKKAPADTTFNAYDAAHKALREHLEKVKCKGYKDKQALLARGKKAFVALIGSKVPADSNVEPFCDWVENELTEIKDDVPCALYLDFHYAALVTIHDELVITLAESVDNPNEPSTLPDSPEAALVRCGLLIAALIESVKDTSGLSATAPELHTHKWPKLLLTLLNAFLGGRLGGPDAASSEIATDKDNSSGRTLLVKDNGVVTLGELLYESTFSSLSVNLVRTIGAMLPSTRLESFIDKAFGDQPWSPEVVDGLKALLAEVKAQIGKVSPAMCKKIVNSIATGESLQRPKGFTLSKFIVNGYDKLDNDKCRRRLQRGDIVVYFDSFAVVVKAYSEDGTEDESLFGIERIKSFKRVTRGGDVDSDFTFQVGSETTVTLGMSNTEADAFEAVTSKLRRTRAQPEQLAPPSVEKELSPEEPAATELGFVDADIQGRDSEAPQGPPTSKSSPDVALSEKKSDGSSASPKTDTTHKKGNSVASPAVSTPKRQSRTAPKPGAGVKGKAPSVVLPLRQSAKNVDRSPASSTAMGLTSSTTRPTRVSAAKASERLTVLALDDLAPLTATGDSASRELHVPPLPQGEEEQSSQPPALPEANRVPDIPDTTEAGPKLRRSWSSLASPDTPKLVFQDIDILEQTPVAQTHQHAAVEVETPTRALPLPRQPLKPALVQNTGHERSIASNETPSHKPDASPAGHRDRNPVPPAVHPPQPTALPAGPSSKGKKSVKITEKAQMAPPAFYPTPIRTPAQDDGTIERSVDQVGGRGGGLDMSGGPRGTVPHPQKPSARVADSSRDVTQEQILSGLNLGLQLSGSGIGTPAASMQHAIIFSAVPTAHTAAPSGPTRRNSAGPADRSSKRIRFSPPSGSREHSIHSTLHALADVATSIFSQRVQAPARKVGRTHRHLASSVEATAQKWYSEASGMTAKVITADAAYQAALQKLNDATRLAKEGAEERHAKVMQKMEASTNVEAIPDSLF